METTRLTAGEERFVEEIELGVGGVGEVVRAVDRSIGRRVAIKRLRPERRNAMTRARFVREIRLVGTLEHPNIVPVHDVGENDVDDVYAVMKWVDGETLHELIGRASDGDVDPRFTMDARVRLFLEVLRGIDHAVQQGILHRDIKPGNIMVGRQGEVQILDWGLATRQSEPETSTPLETLDPEDPSLTIAGRIFGTPAYMSPEQARGERYTERSEVFALGMLLYEMATLRHPVPENWSSQMIIEHAKTRRMPFPHAPVPAHIGRFVRTATHPDPARRFPTVRAMLDEYQRRVDGHVPVECPSTFQRRLAGGVVRLSDRAPTVLSVLIVTIPLGLVALGVWLGWVFGA